MCLLSHDMYLFMHIKPQCVCTKTQNKHKQEGQHPLTGQRVTGQRAANFRRAGLIGDVGL